MIGIKIILICNFFVLFIDWRYCLVYDVLDIYIVIIKEVLFKLYMMFSFL